MKMKMLNTKMKFMVASMMLHFGYTKVPVIMHQWLIWDNSPSSMFNPKYPNRGFVRNNKFGDIIFDYEISGDIILIEIRK